MKYKKIICAHPMMRHTYRNDDNKFVTTPELYHFNSSFRSTIVE